MPDQAHIPTSAANRTAYVNNVTHEAWKHKLNDIKSILDDNAEKSKASRKLRYAEVDIEAEREAGRIQPDELYIPQHLIDTNIRQEQGSYVQYVTESPRAIILQDLDDSSVDLSNLEEDLTKKLRFDGWQLGMYANIDGFQANGYGVMETIQDSTAPGEVAREYVQYGDFAFICDTRNLQSVEMTCRNFFYTRTKLIELSTPGPDKKPEDVWSREQVEKIIEREPSSNADTSDNLTDGKERSLYPIQKIMFRVNGIVYVAWISIGVNDDWLRAPRPLFLGRRKLQPQNPMMSVLRKVTNQLPPSTEDYETQYPYFLYPYLISENDTIMELKGRVFLDQDTQEAVSSLLSSVVTQARRAAGLYFAKDESDPNDDVLLQKNIFFKSGSLINAKVKSFNLQAPDPGIFSAIQMLATSKQVETSQVAFATQNRKDSRKTKKELDLAEQTQQKLSTVQVVLFSLALKQQYEYEIEIIRSRVLAGLIQVPDYVKPLYSRRFSVKPSGDVDVLEKEKLINTMMTAWPVLQTTAAAPIFLSDLIEKMFPLQAPKYIKALNDAQAQQQSAQAQQQQQMMQQVAQMSQGIIELSKHPEYFSDTGRVHAFPIVETTAEQLKQVMPSHKNK